MTSRKCSQCGLVNFAEAFKCQRCHADLGPSGEGNSTSVYITALVVGLLLIAANILFQISRSMIPPIIWVPLIFCVVYGVVAFGLAAASRARDWLLALSLSLFYFYSWVWLYGIIGKTIKFIGYSGGQTNFISVRCF